MNAKERMAAAIHLQPVDRVPNAPFYEAPICNYFGSSFQAALLEAQPMADAHLAALDAFRFDWLMVGMGLIGGIIPEGDRPALTGMGVVAIFGPGTSTRDIVAFFEQPNEVEPNDVG